MRPNSSDAALRPRRAIVLLLTAALGFSTLVAPTPAFAAEPAIAGTLHFGTGLDPDRNFGEIDAYDEDRDDNFDGEIGEYDPITGDVQFEISGLRAGTTYVLNYWGPRLTENPAADGGFIGQSRTVPAGTLDVEFDIVATPFVRGVLQFATGLDPDKRFGALQWAGGSEGVRHDWIDWYGDYDPSTGTVPFLATDYGQRGSVNLTYPGVSGNPDELPIATGYLPVVWDGTPGGSTDWDSVVGIPVGTNDIVLDMREAAGFSGSIALPPGYDPWAGNDSDYLFYVAEVAAVEDDSAYAEILSYDQEANIATYVLNGLEPGAYHLRVSPYGDDARAAKAFVPQLSDGSITLASAEDPETALAASAGNLETADFSVPRPAVVSGTLTQAGAPKGGFTEGRVALVVDGQETFAQSYVRSTSSKPGAESFALAVPAGLRTLALNAESVTYSKSYVTLFSSQSTISLGKATRNAGTTYKVGSKAVARAAIISGYLDWDWPWEETTPSGSYYYDLGATVELLKKVGSEWVVAGSDRTLGVSGSRYQWGPIAAGTYKLRVLPDDPDYCPVSYYGGGTLETAKQIVLKKTTTVAKLVVQPSVECNALFANRTAIKGAQKVGGTLAAVKGAWTKGTSLSYAWYRGETKIGKKSTYTLTKSDAGSRISLVVTGKLTGYPTKTVTVETAKVLSTAVPKISGTTKVGKTLTATAGTWTVGTALTYQWYRGSTPIADATNSTYLLVASDKKKKITVRVTGTLADYATITNVSTAKTIS